MQWQIGPFRLDLDNACLWQGEERLPLRPKAFDILVYMVHHAGDLVTKEELFESVWPNAIVAESALTTTMSELRKVLGENLSEPRFIATLHRRGYRFIAPVHAIDHEPTPYITAPLTHEAAIPPLRLGAIAPFIVAREAELRQLHHSLTQALQGQRQVIFVTGEAGIGKTTLVDSFVTRLPATQLPWIGRGQCVAQYGAGEAYLPILEALSQIGRQPGGDRLVTQFKHYAPSWLRQLPALVSTAEIASLEQRASGTTREGMLRELAEVLESLTTQQPLILVLEDLHWSDVSTVEWVSYIARRRDPARLLVLGTYRPVEVIVHDHPLGGVARELARQGHCTELALPYLSEVEVGLYLSERLETPSLPETFARILYQRTNGNPFFLVTMVDALVQQGVIQTGHQGWRVRENLMGQMIEVPDSIRQLLIWQVEQLDSLAQELLEAASAAGKEFAAAAVAAGVTLTTEAVEEQFSILARRGQIVRIDGIAEWPDGTISGRFSFLHDLYHEMIYERIPPTRRVRLHRQIATQLETSYGDDAAGIAVELAAHFIQSRDDQRAVVYLDRAGRQALQRHAYQEAIHHCTQALGLISRLSKTFERSQQELAILTALGSILIATHGYAAPDVEQTYARAYTVLQELEEQETPQRFSVLYGLTVYQTVRGNFRVAQDYGHELLHLAQDPSDASHLLIANAALGFISFCRGDLVQADTYLEHAIAMSILPGADDLALIYGMDPSVSSLTFAAALQWMRGRVAQAQRYSGEALALARARSHPFSEALALSWTAIYYQLRRDFEASRHYAEAAITLASEPGFLVYLSVGMMLDGWGRVKQGQGQAGLARLLEGLSALRATGAEQGVTWHLGLLAEAYGHVGEPGEGLLRLTEALTLMENNEERFYEAELHRLKGELVLMSADQGQLAQDPDCQKTAEKCFHQALVVSRSQQAKSWELRAATSLARLWRRQGEVAAARDLLAPVYGWFTEGFDTADLQDAKALLTELAALPHA